MNTQDPEPSRRRFFSRTTRCIGDHNKAFQLVCCSCIMHDRSQEFFVMDAPNAHFKAKLFIPKIRFAMEEVVGNDTSASCNTVGDVYYIHCTCSCNNVALPVRMGRGARRLTSGRPPKAFIVLSTGYAVQPTFCDGGDLSCLHSVEELEETTVSSPHRLAMLDF